MADKEIFYNDLIIINLYQKYQKTFFLVGTEGGWEQIQMSLCMSENKDY